MRNVLLLPEWLKNYQRDFLAGDITAGGMAVSYQAGGGEPGYIAADPLDPDQFYSGTNNGGYVNKFNRRTGRQVRCYVPTHSLINYAHWCIVSPQSSLALLDGCDGYIAQVWTGTARTPNHYQGRRRERTCMCTSPAATKGKPVCADSSRSVSSCA